MSFPEIHFGDINQYATKIDEINANKKVFIFFMNLYVKSQIKTK